MSQDPLFWIHLNIDYPFNLTGILYFPIINKGIELQKNKIQLYSNQVYVTDDVKDIVPEFLTLLHGVIDSPDIPLNVSRSYLQADQNVKKITSYITKKVAEKLSQLFKKDRPSYESKWDQIGLFVKYGMLTDEKFYDKAKSFALLKNIKEEFFTLEEYKEKTKDQQTDKYDTLVWLYTPDPNLQPGYIKAAEDKSYDVLQVDMMIDNHFMQHLENKLEKTRFVRVDSDTIDQLINKEETIESELSEKDEEKLKSLFQNAIDQEQIFIKLKPLSKSQHPVLITRPEFIRRMKEMQMMQGMGESEFNDHFEVVVNSNHPLVAEKLLRMRSEDKKQSFARHLYDLARLNQHMLKGDELNEFIERSLEFAG